MRTEEYAEKILRKMQEDGLTKGEVEKTIKILPEMVKANEEQLRRSEPFIVKDGMIYL